MEDQVAEDRGVRVVAGKSKQVGGMPLLRGRPIGGPGPEVESIHRRAGGGEAETEFAGAGAELEGGFAWAQERWKGAGEPAVVAHETVDEPQVAPVVERIRVIRGQGIEDLGLKRAQHGMRGGLPDRGRVSRVPAEL